MMYDDDPGFRARADAHWRADEPDDDDDDEERERDRECMGIEDV